MLMIGLGEAGKNIAKLFKPHSKNYKVILLDENEGLEKKDTVEEYDSIDFKFKQRGLKSHDEAILFLCGSGKVAGASLRILEALRDYKTSVYYIIPDLEFCSREGKRRHRVHFNVIQEYTRSGLFKNMTIISNTKVEEIIGNVPIKNYFSTLNQTIYYVIHYMNYFANKKPLIGNLSNPSEVQRIRTFGMINPHNLSEKMFYELDMARDTSYYVCITSDRLETDGTLHKKLVDTLKNKPRNAFKNLSYAIYESNTDSDFGFCIAHTNAVQSNS